MDSTTRTPKREPTLRRRLLLLATALAVPAAAFQGYVAWEAFRDVGDTAVVMAHERTQSVATSLEGFLTDAESSISALAGVGYELIAPDTCQRHIDIAFRVLPAFSGLVVLNDTGIVVCAGSLATGDETHSTTAPAWFGRLVATREFTISEPLGEPGTDRSVVVLALPLFDDRGGLVGAVGATLTLADLSEWLAARLTADMAFATISDTAGVIVTRSDEPEAWLGTPLGPANYPTLGQGPDWEVLKGDDLDGGFRIIGRVDLASYGWRVYSGLSSQDLLDPGYALARIESFAGLLLLAFAFTLAGWVYRDVGRSLDVLADSLRLAGSGEPLPLPAGVPAELRTVAAALNSTLDARKRAEGRHRDFLRHAPFGVCSFTSEGDFVDTNTALADMLGYESEAELRAVGLSALQPTPGVLPDWVLHLGGSAVVAGHEMVWMSKSGTPVHVRLSGRIMEREAGPVVLEVIVEDVSERRRLEELSRHQQKTEVIGRLAGGIAHEVNNILAVVLGYTNHLVNALAPKSAGHTEADEIKKAVARGAEVTRKLLIASRRDRAPAKAIDLNQAILDLEAMFRGVLPDNIRLVCVTDSLPGNVWINRGHLEQVLLNLVVNGRDAMPAGGRLSISTERRSVRDDGMADFVVLVVEDSGIGMDEATLELAFEPFFTTKPMELGTGLGLSMVAGIVDQAGGRVSAKSVVGEGSTIEVWFPRIDQAGVEEAAPDSRTAPRGTAAMPGLADELRGTESVLLVEDEEALRRLLKVVLTHAGYGVIDAQTAELALELIAGSEHIPDIVVTDVMLPGMSGPDLVRRLGVEIPHLFISGYTAEFVDLTDDALLLEKPFGPGDFLRAVRDTLAGD